LRVRLRGQKFELSDWGLTADYCQARGHEWEALCERLLPQCVSHGRVALEGRELVCRASKANLQWSIGAMVQTILNVTSPMLSSREANEAAFARKVERVINAVLAERHKIARDWHDPDLDPHKAFVVDYRVNGNVPPAHLFVVGTTSKISRVTATSLFYKSRDVNASAVVILNPEMQFGRKQQERVQVAADHIIWDIDRQGDRLTKYVEGARDESY
jgi:hypothetical protein